MINFQLITRLDDGKNRFLHFFWIINLGEGDVAFGMISLWEKNHISGVKDTMNKSRLQYINGFYLSAFHGFIYSLEDTCLIIERDILWSH